MLLFLHGGPGMPAMYTAHAFQRPLERDFVVVHWDQRGAGKSYRSELALSTMTMTQMLADAETVIGRLRREFGIERVILVGHSHGTRDWIAMFHLKGAMSRVAEGATAFGNRQASHAITVDAVWRPGEEFGERDTAWARSFFAALGEFREGVYVIFIGGDEDPNRIREAYGDAVYQRLAKVKTTYDPDDVFHHNQNIRPN